MNEKQAIEAKYGAWTAHNIYLPDGSFTIGPEVCGGNEVKLRRVMQIIADLDHRALYELKALDLACLEGGYGIELARHGANVCAIEGRTGNIEKSRFAADVMRLHNIEFYKDDVRNVSLKKYGLFDVVLCLGIFYHLNNPDVFKFLEQIFAESCHLAIIDTHVSLYSQQEFEYKGRKYMGKTVVEHASEATADEIEKNVWASLDNHESVYFTRSSLYSLLYDVGFTSVYECHVPQWPDKPEDRVTLVAVKGTTIPLYSCPQLGREYARELPQEPAPAATHQARRPLRLLGKLVPRGFRQIVRHALLEN